jgi:hypothetical protein
LVRPALDQLQSHVHERRYGTASNPYPAPCQAGKEPKP